MEMLAKDFMIEPAFDDLVATYGDDILVVAYMNTSGRVKALAGRTGGAVCTSSNAKRVVGWALEQGRPCYVVPGSIDAPASGAHPFRTLTIDSVNVSGRPALPSLMSCR